jgi:membrane protein implicated in regulation of membrane protease activity
MDWPGLWAAIWPGWDSVYPNLVASLIWSPAVALLAWVWHRVHKRRHAELAQGHAELKRMISGLHDTVRRQDATRHERMEEDG